MLPVSTMSSQRRMPAGERLEVDANALDLRALLALRLGAVVRFGANIPERERRLRQPVSVSDLSALQVERTGGRP